MNNIDKITSYMHNVDVEEYAAVLGITLNDAMREYCQTFLIITDHIPNKIIEAQALGNTPKDYTEILELRQYSRDVINDKYD